jgi:hypothetical protein
MSHLAPVLLKKPSVAVAGLEVLISPKVRRLVTMLRLLTFSEGASFTAETMTTLTLLIGTLRWLLRHSGLQDGAAESL